MCTLKWRRRRRRVNYTRRKTRIRCSWSRDQWISHGAVIPHNLHCATMENGKTKIRLMDPQFCLADRFFFFFFLLLLLFLLLLFYVIDSISVDKIIPISDTRKINTRIFRIIIVCEKKTESSRNKNTSDANARCKLHTNSKVLLSHCNSSDNT